MKDFIKNISEIIDDRFKISKTRNSITINETDTMAVCKKITINLRGKKIFAFNLDQKRTKTFRTFPFFNPSIANISMINDGIIAITENNKIIFLLFELKSNNFKSEEVYKKLKNAEYFCKYFIDILNEHYNKNYQKIVFKSVLVTTKVNKTPSTKNKRFVFEKFGDFFKSDKYNIDFFIHIPCNNDYEIDKFL